MTDNQPIRYIPLDRVKSKWYRDILKEWTPNHEYIQHLIELIKKEEYLPPVVLVKEADEFFIVNGHHRFYAHLVTQQKRIKGIVIDGSFEDTEPLRKAESMLKEYDQRSEFKFQFSGYLDRWAASAENIDFINKYKPTLGFKLFMSIRKLKDKILKKK